MAWVDLKAGRVDRRDAFRIAVTVFVCSSLTALFDIDHRLDEMHEQSVVMYHLAIAIQSAFRYWLMYAAVEPYFRRIMPELMPSWNCLLAGRFHDPLVGKHLLAGILGLFVGAFVTFFSVWVLDCAGFSNGSFRVGSVSFSHLARMRCSISVLLPGIQPAIYVSLYHTTICLIASMIFKRKKFPLRLFLDMCFLNYS